MKRILAYLTALSICWLTNVVSSYAQPSRWETYMQEGQLAYDNHRYRKAQTMWLKALTEVEGSGQDDQQLASTLTKLAQVLRQSEDYGGANDYLQRALVIYQRLGKAHPEFAQEYAELSRAYRLIDLERLGTGTAETLKANSAKMCVVRQDTGNHVQIDVPERFEKSLNSTRVDQIGLEKLVTFDISRDGSGWIEVSKIKGFKIHSVERNTWANLYNLLIKSIDAEGKYDAVITAGKAGITKVVDGKISPKAYEPIVGIAMQAEMLGTPEVLSIQVDTAQAASVPTTEKTNGQNASLVLPEPGATVTHSHETTHVAPVQQTQPLANEKRQSARDDMQQSGQTKPQASSKNVSREQERDRDDDDDDDDHDDDEQEDDHAILHFFGKLFQKK
ncbi:MAG: tetratricopeptide repeat protein [Candidatus Melainabacteria bacterium]|nr:tetratricopeptide repeat protein [Candidatus Melainabacteria bacterium]